MPSYEDLQRINKANSIINRSNISIGLRPMYLHTVEEETETEQNNFAQSDESENQEAEYYQEEDFYIEEVEASQELFEKNPETEITTAEEFYEKHAEYLEALEFDNSKNQQEEMRNYHTEEIEEEYHQDHKQNFFDFDNLDAEPLFSPKKISIKNSIKAPKNFSFSRNIVYTAFAVITAVYLIFTFKPVSTAPITSQNFEETKLQELTKKVSSKEPRSLIITSGNFSSKAEAEAYKKALNEKLGVPLIIVLHEKTYSVQIGSAYANHADALVVFDELSRYSVEHLSIKVGV